MKISTKLFNQQQVSRFGKLNEEIQSLQNKISTGKNIVQASDDPIGAVNLSGLQQVKERFSQYSRSFKILNSLRPCEQLQSIYITYLLFFH